MMKRQQGSVAVLVALMTILVGGLVLALSQLCFAYHRAAAEALEHELAVRSAESGVSYCLARLSVDSDYFAGNPAPHASRNVGEGSFVLEQATPKAFSDEWNVVVNGRYGRSNYRLEATIGYRRLRFPSGLVVAGGDPEDQVFRLNGGSTVASFDPSVGAFDVNAPGDNSGVSVNGSLAIGGSSTVHGDVMATGQIENDGSAKVTGTVSENGPEVPVDEIDSFVLDAMAQSALNNDNSVLSGIFGSQWSRLRGDENYGDLIVDDPRRVYIVPAGTYRVRRFEVRGGATIIFDTSTGPTTLAYVGEGKGTGSGNDLTVSSGSHVKVHPGGTSNGLLTILGADCDFKVSSSSTYGQGTGSYLESITAAFSQIISLGGDGGSDSIEVGAGSRVYGRLYATAHDVKLSGNSTWYGSAVVREMTISGSRSGPAAFVVDESLGGSIITDPTNFDVLARWRASDQTDAPPVEGY